MKIYSNDTVSKAQLDTVGEALHLRVSAVDAKQDSQIKQLRIWLAASFLVNLAVSAVLAVQLFDLAQIFK